MKFISLLALVAAAVAGVIPSVEQYVDGTAVKIGDSTLLETTSAGNLCERAGYVPDYSNVTCPGKYWSPVRLLGTF
jgi:hypothetical protein